MADSTMTVKVVPELDEEAFREQVLELITSHAIVKPGETLVIRGKDWTPDQVEQYQDYLAYKQLPFRVLVVGGDELAIASPEPDEVFAGRVKRVIADEARKAQHRAASRRFPDVR